MTQVEQPHHFWFRSHGCMLRILLSFEIVKWCKELVSNQSLRIFNRVLIHLSYPCINWSTGRILPPHETSLQSAAYLFSHRYLIWSGWSDSNGRLLGSRPRTLTRLSYTPIKIGRSHRPRTYTNGFGVRRASDYTSNLLNLAEDAGIDPAIRGSNPRVLPLHQSSIKL